MEKNQDPLRMSHEALMAAKEEFNPRWQKDEDDLFIAVCREIYHMPPERFREYLVNRGADEEEDG